MKVMALIPARGGSTRLPGKNMRTFGDCPLIGWSIRVAYECSEIIDRIVVSSDDPDILAYCKKPNVQLIKRPAIYSRTDTPTLPVINHALEDQKKSGYEPDIIVLLQPTSPLRIADDIRAAYAMFDSRNAEAVISISETECPWEVGHAGRLRRIKPSLVANSVVVENGAIYMVRADVLSAGGDLFPNLTYGYPMPMERSVDIDTLADFEFAEQLLRNRVEFSRRFAQGGAGG